MMERIQQHSTIMSVDDGFGCFLSSADSIDDMELPPLGISVGGNAATTNSTYGLNHGVLNLLSGAGGEGIEMMVMTPPRPRYFGQLTNTPPSTTPIYNVLPPIISPSDHVYMEDSDCEMLAPLAEAFRPPPTTTKKSSKNKSSNRSSKNNNNNNMKATRKADRGSSLGNPAGAHRPDNVKSTTAAAARPVSPSLSSSTSTSNHFFMWDSRQVDRLIECMRRSHVSRREILRSRRLFLANHHPSLNEMERLDESQRRMWEFLTHHHQHNQHHRGPSKNHSLSLPHVPPSPSLPHPPLKPPELMATTSINRGPQ